MKKCVGLIMVVMLGGAAGAGLSDMGLFLTPAGPLCNQDVQLKIDVCMPLNCSFRTQLHPMDGFGMCMVDLYEDCDGCNRQRVSQTIPCDLGRNLRAGQYMAWVQHYINPCHNPKCKQCCTFVSRDKPQLCGLTSMWLNVCSLNTNPLWWLGP